MATHVSRRCHVKSLINNNRFNNVYTIYIPQSRTDLESHAYTYIVGRNDIITHYHETNGQPIYVNIVAYDPTVGSVSDMHVVNVVVAYDCPEIGKVIMIKTNQAIHVSSTENNLLCNMHLRMNEVNIFESKIFD